jgi:hypothetical protein
VNAIVDTYSRRARLEPALFVALPLALVTLAWFPSSSIGWGALSSVLVWCGGTTIITQIVRDFGKRLEAKLFEKWGGKPTTVALRLSETANRALTDRRRAKIQLLMGGAELPDLEQELADPKGTDDALEAATKYLLENTRDRKKFPLIFEENCNYGFRRNLLALKPVGLVLAVVGIAAASVLFFVQYYHGERAEPLQVICAVLVTLVLLVWLFVISENWVRAVANDFSDRLLSASETM